MSGPTLKLHGFYTRGKDPKKRYLNVMCFLWKNMSRRSEVSNFEVTNNNLVWQQINSRRYSTVAIELFGLVQVPSIASYSTLEGKN